MKFLKGDLKVQEPFQDNNLMGSLSMNRMRVMLYISLLEIKAERIQTFTPEKSLFWCRNTGWYNTPLFTRAFLKIHVIIGSFLHEIEVIKLPSKTGFFFTPPLWRVAYWPLLNMYNQNTGKGLNRIKKYHSIITKTFSLYLLMVLPVQSSILMLL